MKRQDLNEFISKELHELSWDKNYSLNKGVAVWSFINGLRDGGFVVDIHSEPLKIFYVFSHNDRSYELSANISEEEVLCGWNNYPKSSPQALHDSIYLTIDRLQKKIKEGNSRLSHNLSEALFNDRTRKGHIARRAMEKYFLEYFERYQEGILMPLNGDNGKEDMHEPEILNRLIESDVINLDKINEGLIISQSTSGLVNAYSTIAFLKDNQPLEEGVVISSSRVLDYVWGVYLLGLSEIKDYPLKEWDKEDKYYGILEVMCEKGRGMLEDVIRK